MAKLSPAERETMISFRDEDFVATVYTCSPDLQKKLMKLCGPDGVGYFAGTYHSGNSPMVFFLSKQFLLRGLPDD